MAKKQSEILSEEQEILRAEIKLITDKGADATDDEVTRAEELTEEFKAKEILRQKALKREADVEEVMRAALNPAQTETTTPGAPTVISRNKRDPYENLIAVRSMTLTSGEVVSRALDAIEQAPEHMDHDAREQATRLVQKSGKRQGALIARHILLTGGDEYHAAFENYLENPENAQRAALSLTSANGGYLVPFTLDPSIVLTNSGSANPFRQISAIKTTATNTWNGVTSAGVNAGWLAEGTEDTDHTPTFGNIQITPQKASAWVFGSYEVLEDSDFATQLPMLLADAKDRLEEAAFTTGTGTGQPKGIITAATTTQATAGVATYAVGDVYNTQAAVPARWRSKASWLGNLTIINKTRQFDTAGGSSFWANLGAGQPEQLLGSSIYESTTMVGTTTTGSKILAYGDFSQFAIVDRIGMSVLYEPMVKGAAGRPTGQGGWFAFWRTGSDVLTANAFRVLAVA